MISPDLSIQITFAWWQSQFFLSCEIKWCCEEMSIRKFLHSRDYKLALPKELFCGI